MTETTDDVVAEVIQALTPPSPWEKLKAQLEAQLELEKVRLDHQLDSLRHVPLP